MKNSLLMPAAAAAILSWTAACVILPDPGNSGSWRKVPGSELAPTEVRETHDFAQGATLSLENEIGSVKITGWDQASAEVVARLAEEPSGPEGSARASGGRGAKLDVDIRKTGGGLHVRTRTFEGPGDPPVVEYDIRVPSSVVLAGIRIGEGDLSVADVYGRIGMTLERGNLAVSNYSGTIEATIGAGNADVEVLDLREGDAVTVISRKGDIVLRLEPGVGAIVEADAPRGEVRSDFDLGVKLPVSTVKGWIRQGGPNIILKAADGRIEIRAVK